MIRTCLAAERNVKHQDAAAGMERFLDVHTKSDRREKLLGHRNGIIEGVRADSAWWLVADSKQQDAATFVRDCNAAPVELVVVVLRLRLLEFQSLMLFWRH